MNASLRIEEVGKQTLLELDGKTMGIGIGRVEYIKDGAQPGQLTIHINDLQEFRFYPDGTFDKAAEWRKAKELPEKPFPAAPWD